MRRKTLRNLRFTYELAMIVLGCFILGFGFIFFLEANHLSTGGFSGLSMVINYLLTKAEVKFLSTPVIYLILNIILFLFSYKILGPKFSFKAAIGILSFTLSMQVFELIPNYFELDLIIASLYGGLLVGIGVGIAVRFGGSTGGGDMLACIICHKTKKITIGGVLRIVDICVLLLQTIVFSNGLNLLPYTLIAVVISTFALDFINENYKVPLAYNIITTKHEQISFALMKYLKRGCTKLETKGMYSNSNSKMIVCVVSGFQARDLKNIVSSIDPKAFVYSHKVKEIVGNFEEIDYNQIAIENKYLKQINKSTQKTLNKTKSLNSSTNNKTSKKTNKVGDISGKTRQRTTKS